MNVLAINPWIYDFAAYDFWLKPYGFLVILSYLKTKGIHIDYIDCLEEKTEQGTFGRGKYSAENVPKPDILKSIPRYFKRYGIEIAEFKNYIKDKNPDFILITSSMTYWYPGISETVRLLKEEFSHVPIILGGTYATLCYEHATQNITCDFTFKNNSLKDFFKVIGVEYNYEELYSTIPSYKDFYKKLDYLVLRTSWGCPFSCSYCAIKELFPQFYRLSSEKVLDLIIKYSKDGIKDFVLYDDAFLYESEYIKKLLKEIIKLNLNIRFHTPNALHLRFLDEEIACLLKKVGFTNPHFGLETLNYQLQKLWGDKVNREDLIKGIELLKNGGFKSGEFSVYLLLGYPEQSLEELKQDVEFLHSLGARVSLAEFSPVSGTKIFQEYGKEFSEPLLHNNSIFGFFQKEKIKDFWEIKNYTRDLNKKLI
ncbi:MAG: radical SAM protein [Candidatus Omnitrophota bacterium]|nr:radical SAM protein [Candidatus Omnitrophota bacterium]